jgi:formamidopyrimidine-DNA glycosylase
MPELPEVESVRRQLERAMRGKTIARVLLRRANLRRPFPEGFAFRLEGQTIQSLRRRGKYLLLDLISGDTLLIHLGMTGSFRIATAHPSPADAHDHVLFELTNGSIVTFNDPRRFGVMDLIEQHTDGQHRAFKSMGVEPLDASFDAHVMARAFANRKTAIKVALLDQRNIAGLGNIYASEALHRAGLTPTRRASTIATKTGLPRPAAFDLTKAIKAVLRSAIERQERP